MLWVMFVLSSGGFFRVMGGDFLEVHMMIMTGGGGGFNGLLFGIKIRKPYKKFVFEKTFASRTVLE